MLYLEGNHYLEGIVANQPHLRLLGIRTDSRIPEINQGLSCCRTMPTVFALADLLVGHRITMFPAFHQPGDALRVCREVASSLNDWSHFFRGEDRFRLSVSLLGTSQENISLLSELMEALASCLQYYGPRASTHFSVIIHENSIQVSSQPSQGVRTFIIA